MSAILDATRTKRDKRQSKLDELLKAPEKEARSLTDEEAARFETLSADLKSLDKELKGLVAKDERDAKAAAAVAAAASASPVAAVDARPVIVRSEPQTYDRHSGNSYLLDLGVCAAAMIEPGKEYLAVEARGRLNQHQKETEIEARHDKALEQRLWEAKMELRVNPSGNVAGQGGEFVPPLWAESLYIPYLRAGRVLANRVNQQGPVPPGYNVINIPKITLGGLTGIQTAQGAGVTSQDPTTSAIAANVNTISGQVDISLQLLEQSPLAMDGVVFNDLSASYDQQLDLQVYSGSGTGGQHLGVNQVTSRNAVSCTSATWFGTAAGVVPSIAAGISVVATKRFMSPTAVWMHPRRWFWGQSLGDTTGRPFSMNATQMPMNAVSTVDPGAPVQGHAGFVLGLPVFIDANIPVLTGGTQDEVVVVKEDDLFLWENSLRLRALPEVLSGTLQIRFQLYSYSAFMANRLPVAISHITGAGLAANTSF